VATAEYQPGGITILDAQTLNVVKRLPADIEKNGQKTTSRATGVVDAPGNRFVCVLIEGAEIWVIDASGSEPKVERKVKTSTDEPYDAMITPDGRWYVVGHMGSEHVSVLDLKNRRRDQRSARPEAEVRQGGAGEAPAHGLVGRGGRQRVRAAGRRAAHGRARSAHLGLQEERPRSRAPRLFGGGADRRRDLGELLRGGDDAYLEVIDAEARGQEEHQDGRSVYHLDFTRGGHVIVSANKDNKLALVDATTYAVVDEETVNSPSGVFGAWRAFRIGL
jgi:protein NirF